MRTDLVAQHTVNVINRFPSRWNYAHLWNYVHQCNERIAARWNTACLRGHQVEFMQTAVQRDQIRPMLKPMAPGLHIENDAGSALDAGERNKRLRNLIALTALFSCKATYDKKWLCPQFNERINQHTRDFRLIQY